jgi:REP element-mobilizing transposase RayT
VSEYIHKSYNVSVLLYHLVCPTKYRRAIVSAPVEATLRDICGYIETCYEIWFLEIGSDRDHVHFLIQTIPTMSPTALVRLIKSITTRELRSRLPSLRKEMWGASFWSSGYFISTVGRHGNEQTISRYVRNQGEEGDYSVIHRPEPDFRQLELFSD